MQKLDPKATAIAFGGTMALGIMLLAIFGMLSANFGRSVISIISSVYIGYRPSVPGALIGGFWAFVDGGICGWIFAWIYNKVQEKCN